MDDDMFFWRRIYFIEKIRDFKSARLFEQLVKADFVIYLLAATQHWGLPCTSCSNYIIN
jgi:hypothetical protein